jgi:ubiquilin
MMQQMMGGGGGGGGLGGGAAPGGNSAMTAMLQQMMGGGGGTGGAGGAGLAGLMSSPMMQQAMGAVMSNPELMRQAMSGASARIAGASPFGSGGGGFAGSPFGGAFFGAPAAPAARGALTADAVASALRELELEASSSSAAPPAAASLGIFGTGGNGGPAGATELVDVSALEGASTEPAAGHEPYAAQVESLDAMGFTDRAASLRALRAAGGDVDVAIEALLSG